MDDLILIRTKLNRPRIVSDLVERPRLVAKLNKGLEQKLTLVSAPAGYGKSTAVSAWAKSVDFPQAWLSLDEYDNDLAAFGIYLAEAVRTAYHNACQTITPMLRASVLPPPNRLADAFLIDLEALPGELLLILDDYHTIQILNVHAFMKRVVQRLPSHIQIVMISRKDPPLNLPRLRAHQQLAEIRSADLRFTAEETHTLLQKLVGKPIDDEITTLLTERTEGWPAGLRMAGVSLRNSDNQHTFVKRFAQSQHHRVMDYLIGEVLDGMSESQQNLVLQTSIVDRFSAGLCEKITGQTPAGHSYKAFVADLRGSNLFTIPLDDEGVWYRYHHLFRDLLQMRLRQIFSKEAIAQMHQRASYWFAENDLVDEAIQHTLAADDVVRAAKMVEQNRIDLMNADQWQVLERWLDRLPNEIKQQRPTLLLTQAWVHMARFRVWESMSMIESAEAILGDDETDPALRGEIDFFMAYLLYWQNQGVEGFQLLQRSLKRLPSTYLMPRGEAQYLWGLVGQQAGKQGMVVKGLTGMLTKEFAQQDPQKSRLLGSLGFIHLISGELIKSEEMVQQAIARSNNPYVEAWIHYTLGVIHYCWNDLEKATHYFEQAGRNRYAYQFRAAADCLVGLTLTRLGNQ
jgi:LuxR family maltose regulon positive regulatory protein